MTLEGFLQGIQFDPVALPRQYTDDEVARILKTRNKLPLAMRVTHDAFVAAIPRIQELTEDKSFRDFPPTSIEYWALARIEYLACKDSGICRQVLLEHLTVYSGVRVYAKTMNGYEPPVPLDPYAALGIPENVLDEVCTRGVCPCGRLAIRGATPVNDCVYCERHMPTETYAVEAADSVAKVLSRIQGLADRAVTTLVDVMDHGEKDSDRLKAAESILDRAGLSRTAKLELDVEITTHDSEIERLLSRVAQAAANRSASIDVPSTMAIPSAADLLGDDDDEDADEAVD